jgi:alkanesulfonate monooxygenase SsuD/methylene tetrahydromethanopterin reductase-like flavin-dependent oxidoreductase (luciferase family)
LRNPFTVAKAIASLDQLSNGRFLFGIGIGWLQEEFEWVGADWNNRARRNNEALELMEALFTQEIPRFKGATVSTQEFLLQSENDPATSSTFYHRRQHRRSD